MFVVFLSTIKEAKEGSTEQELRETIYNIMFGEDNKLKTNGITFNNIDLELLNEIKSSINDL
jgi:alkylhydroperoxidase/carboxymuconolactone decarboxylase family protein YurZ